MEGKDSVENTKLVFEGDVSRVKRIGQNMSAGEIEINGNVDMHCGFAMKGGKVVINGNATLARCECQAEIILNRNAAYYVVRATAESPAARGGKITVNGNARTTWRTHVRRKSS